MLTPGKLALRTAKCAGATVVDLFIVVKVHSQGHEARLVDVLGRRLVDVIGDLWSTTVS